MLIVFFFYLLSSMQVQREREKKEERERAREIHRIHYEFRTVSRGRIVCSMFVFFFLYIDIHIRIFFVFFVRYIISVIFIHARDICSSLKIRVFFFLVLIFIHRVDERVDEQKRCEERKMPIRSEQDETTGRLFFTVMARWRR